MYLEFTSQHFRGEALVCPFFMVLFLQVLCHRDHTCLVFGASPPQVPQLRHQSAAKRLPVAMHGPAFEVYSQCLCCVRNGCIQLVSLYMCLCPGLCISLFCVCVCVTSTMATVLKQACQVETFMCYVCFTHLQERVLSCRRCLPNLLERSDKLARMFNRSSELVCARAPS